MSISEGASKHVLREGEAVASSTKKVPKAAIEHVWKAIQNAPECTAKEIPKMHAIRALLPDIEQLQSKGYDWKAVASFLSEHGIALHVVTLKSLPAARKGRGRQTASQAERWQGGRAEDTARIRQRDPQRHCEGRRREDERQKRRRAGVTGKGTQRTRRRCLEGKWHDR